MRLLLAAIALLWAGCTPVRTHVYVLCPRHGVEVGTSIDWQAPPCPRH